MTAEEARPLTTAVGRVLIDMELDDGWRAIETQYGEPGRVVVTLRKSAEGPTECTCDQIEGADECCEVCAYGPPEPDYRDVVVLIPEEARA